MGKGGGSAALRRVCALGLVVAAGLVAPSVASAGTVTVSTDTFFYGQLQYTGTDAVNTVTLDGSSTGGTPYSAQITFYDSTEAITIHASAQSRCAHVMSNPNRVACTVDSLFVSGGCRRDDGGSGAGIHVDLAGGNDVLTANTFAPFIDYCYYLGGGDDQVQGGGSDEWIYGEAGGDTINGGAAPDFVMPGLGPDVVTDSGAAGDMDVLSYFDHTQPVSVGGPWGGAEDGPGESVAAGTFEVYHGGEGGDVMTGDHRGEWIFGFEGDDTLSGNGGNDRLEGAGGEDELYGGGGDDEMAGLTGADTYDGGAGADLIQDYTSEPNVLLYTDRTEDLAITIDSGNGNDGGATDGPPGARDTVQGIREIRTGTGDDDITGSPGGGPERFASGGGDDVLAGLGGDDHYDGGVGSDTISEQASAGFDTITYAGRAAGVVVTLGAGTDGNNLDESATDPALRDTVPNTVEAVVGTDGNDVLTGSDDGNTLTGGAGADTLRGGLGPDRLEGGAGADKVTYSERTVAVTVDLDGTADDGNADDSGADNVLPDVEHVAGGDGGDSITGGSAPETLEGGPGGDVVDGGGGQDTLDGGDGGDTLRARDGVADSVACGGGADGAVVDDGDQVASDCESVERPPPPVVDPTSVDQTGTLPGGQTVPAPAGGAVADRTPPVVTVALARGYSLRAVVRSGLAFGSRCSEACIVRGVLSMTANGRSVRVGTVTVRIAAGGRGRPVVKLTTKARRAIRRLQRRPRLTLRVTATDAAGNAARPVTRSPRLRA